MATRLKPSRINVDNTPRVGDGAAYQNDNDFHWSEGGGDMSYEDFEWVTLTGNSLVIENISNNVTPTGNFTVSAGTLRPGIEYVLRVNTGNTPYTMTLGTGVTNPNGYSTELTPNKVNQFKFIATSDSQLELEGVDTSDFVTLGTQQTITAKKTFNVEPELGTAKTTDATNNGTKLATEAQVYKKIDKVQSPTADHLASLTSGGEFADSGIAKSTVELNTNKETGDAPTDTTSKYPSSHTVKKYVDDQVAAATAGAVSNVAYGSSWDGVTGIAPSKNVVYDKISAMDTTIGNKANDSDVVKLTGNQTVSGTKTFSTSPVVPSKTTDATNTGTAIATEAQVYKKQDKLVSGTNIKTVNNNSLLGSGNLTLNDVKVSATASSSPTEGMVWYDTTNDQLKVYDGTNWNVTGKEYNAGEGIEIKNGPDYSAMRGPASDGFHVPSKDEWVALCEILTTTFSMASNATTVGTYLKMPMAGQRDYSSANVGHAGSYGRYWSSNSYSADASRNLGFSSSYINTQNTNLRTYGFSVRCFKDAPTMPTSSWATLYDGSSIASGAGVFWNNADGLISVSGDGQTWITIADKNLGATTVYNQGDGLTNYNCGYFYQWGNNYGFPHSGTLTTSSTQVDASNYGPGNYYSSSTFITRSSSPYDWSSVQNDNLWGGVTGVVTYNNAITNTGVLSINGQTGDVTVTTHSTITVTLTSAGWSSKSQTVSATGVTASNTVIVSPAPADIQVYADCGVYGYGQGSGTLTFKCDTAPSGDIVVNVLIMS